MTSLVCHQARVTVVHALRAGMDCERTAQWPGDPRWSTSPARSSGVEVPSACSTFRSVAPGVLVAKRRLSADGSSPGRVTRVSQGESRNRLIGRGKRSGDAAVRCGVRSRLPPATRGGSAPWTCGRMPVWVDLTTSDSHSMKRLRSTTRSDPRTPASCSMPSSSYCRLGRRSWRSGLGRGRRQRTSSLVERGFTRSRSVRRWLPSCVQTSRQIVFV